MQLKELKFIKISFCYLQTEVADLMWQTVHGGESKFQHVCGVPYTALPIATVSVWFHTKLFLLPKSVQ